MKSRAKRVWPLAIVGAMLVARCGGAIAPVPAVAEDAAVPMADDAELPFLNLDSGVAADAPNAPQPEPDGGFDPPTVMCSLVDAGDAAVCSMPPSVCANDWWLVYYDHGQCVSGLCAWSKHFRECNCYKGACTGVITAPPQGF